MAVVMSSTCPHVVTIGDYTKEDIIRKQEISKCDACDCRGPSLWVCLHRDCLFVGCGEAFSDHSTKHCQEKTDHSLILNLSTLRVWCSLCVCEVFLENNDPPLAGMLPAQNVSTSRVYVADPDSEVEDEGDNQHLKPRGLTGLQNLGNTCYMNAALQALSNCPQLTNFFLDCGSFVCSDKKPGLAKNYMRLVKEIWHKRRPSYVAPSGIAYGIKMVFPVFRGYTQQDAQEFLRCFMDQLHEELKERIVGIDGYNAVSPDSTDDFDSCQGESVMGMSEDSSQSEAEFETCDSGLSSEKSSCSEECGEPSESLVEDEESHVALPFDCSNHMGQNSHVQRHSVDLSKEMKDCLTCRQTVSDSRQIHAKGDAASDSGFLGSTSVNASDISSYFDRRSPVLRRGGERYSEFKRIHGSYSSRQQTSIQGQQISRSSVLAQISTSAKSTNRRKKPVQFRSVISDIFDGKILSSVQCLTCDTLSTTKETFQDLSLPIPNRDHLHMLHASQGNQKGAGACTDVYSHQGWISWIFGWMLSWFWGPTVSLQDCLAAFFSADELKGDNMYSCEKCKKLRNGIKYSKVLQLPEILCIHLKRFRHEVMFSSKINSYVSFPLEGLDMSPFLHKDCPRGVSVYDLAAVICHHGTAGSGHYTAYALNCLNDQWYEFDDQYVTAVDPQVVQNCEAYVLFYRKSSEEMIKKRQCAVELMERSKSEPGLLHFFISKQWVNKFNTFAEPGPIANTDFLCPHGGVHPSKATVVEELVTVLSQAVWEYLHDTFGGGPSCTHLYLCPICQAEQESLDRRRRQEHDTFVTLNKEFQAQDSPLVIYGISMNWFKQWESFVRNKENDIPGPIDNSTICYSKGTQTILKPGSDYGSLSEEMWRFLFVIYGGGPELILQQNISGVTTSSLPPPAGVHTSSCGGSSRSMPTASAGEHCGTVSSSAFAAKNFASSHSSTPTLSSSTPNLASGKKIPAEITKSTVQCEEHHAELEEEEMEKD